MIGAAAFSREAIAVRPPGWPGARGGRRDRARGINGFVPRQEDLEKHPPIPCWFCFRRLPVAKIVADGIILGRDAEHGGPERLFICPFCLKENLCEETLKGRWFASPRISVGILEVLFSKLPGMASEEVIQAISWYRENEDRRRSFFLRDGDDRYVGKNFLLSLWPWGSEAGKGARPRMDRGRAAKGKTGGGTGASSRPAGDGSRGGPGDTKPPPRRPRPERPSVVTPFEILGLPPGAGPDQIRKAFHRLAVQYHPDKVHHLGEEFRSMAHVKFQELKRAYDALMSRRA